MRNLNRVSLGGLRAIEAVGRLGSLRLAAEDIGVTIGAISQQIQKTERQLGRTLFERRPKGLVLTDLGQGVLRHLTRGMGELSAAISLAENSDEKQADRIGCTGLCQQVAGLAAEAVQ